jgi:hypothetical protein
VQGTLLPRGYQIELLVISSQAPVMLKSRSSTAMTGILKKMACEVGTLEYVTHWNTACKVAHLNEEDATSLYPL